MAKIVLRPEVIAFAVLMERKLQANDHKGGWQECPLEWLLGRLVEETYELAGTMHGNPITVGKEAADVGNFALMMADNAGSLRWLKQMIAEQEITCEIDLGPEYEGRTKDPHARIIQEGETPGV